MNITQHIATLLQLHECVIIPDFGAFITNYVPTRFNAAENKYYPPTREVAFNPKIVKNDGLLMNHLVDVENLTYQQSRNAIMLFCDQAFHQLSRGEKIVFQRVGMLAFDRNGTFVFSSSTENLLLEAYGLTAVQPYPAIKRSNTSYAIRPAIRAIQGTNHVLKIAASVALLLSLSLIPIKSDKLIGMSNTNPIQMVLTLNEPALAEKEAEGIEAEVFAEVEVVPEAPKRYVLVGGTFSLRENAQKYHEELLANGNVPELYQKEDGNFRVTVNSFSDWDEALTAMEKYREENPGSQVWVSKR